MPLNQADQLRLNQKRSLDYYQTIWSMTGEDDTPSIDSFMPKEIRYKYRRIHELKTNTLWECSADAGDFVQIEDRIPISYLETILSDSNQKVPTSKAVLTAIGNFSRSFRFATLSERNAHVAKLLDRILVDNDGDGKWALYIAVTEGTSANYYKISDPDLLNASMTNQQIKSAYEQNSDTNVFTDAEKQKLLTIAEGAQVNTQADWSASSGASHILNKPFIPTKATDIHAFPTGYTGDVSNLDTLKNSGLYAISHSGHSRTMLVLNASGSSGPIQLEHRYNGQLRFRNNTDSGNTWSGWNTLYHTGNKPSPAELGAFSASGGTVSGDTIFTKRLQIGFPYNGGVGSGFTLYESASEAWDLHNASHDLVFSYNSSEQYRFNYDGMFQAKSASFRANLNANPTTRAEAQAHSVLTLKPNASNSTHMGFFSYNSGNGMGLQVTNSSGTADWDIHLNPFGGKVYTGNDFISGANIHANQLYSFGVPYDHTRGLGGTGNTVLFDLTNHMEKESSGSITDSGSSDSLIYRTPPNGAPGGKAIYCTSYKSIYSDYLPVNEGETLYGEISTYRESDGTGTVYYGIERYDKDKKPITSNGGCVYFVAANPVPPTGAWKIYAGKTTLPTSHTPYNGSDGGAVKYVRVRLLLNYSSGTAPTYYAGIKLIRKAELQAGVFSSDLTISGNSVLGSGGHTTHVNDSLYIGSTDSGDSHLYFGENTSNWYGSHWYWDSGHTHHWYSRHAGTDNSIMYHDTRDTEYLHMQRSFHMHNYDLNFVKQVHFNSDVRFLDNNNNNYLVYKFGNVGTGGIQFKDGNDVLRGYVYSNPDGFGLLDKDGNWGVKIATDLSTSLHVNSSEILNAHSSGVRITGDLTTTNGLNTTRAVLSEFAEIRSSETHYMRLYTEANTTSISDIFSDTTTDKSFLYFRAGDGSNDSGYIMHETSETNVDYGVLHLCPSDNNSGLDHVSIHGTGLADRIRLYTDGRIHVNGVDVIGSDAKIDANRIKNASWANATHTHTASQVGLGNVSNYAQVRLNSRTDGYAWIRRATTGGDAPLYLTQQSTGNIAAFYQGAGDGTYKAAIGNDGHFDTKSFVNAVAGFRISGTSVIDSDAKIDASRIKNASWANISHTHAKASVGLGNVTNESKSTMFNNSSLTGTTKVNELIIGGKFKLFVNNSNELEITEV